MGRRNNIYGSYTPFTKSYELDGINDYMWITDGSQVGLGLQYNDTFSLGGWFKMTASVAATQFLMSKQENVGNFRGYSLLVTGGELRITVINSVGDRYAVESNGSGIGVGNWYHFYVTYSLNNANVYIDGVDQVLTTIASPVSNTMLNAVDFQIGGRHGANLLPATRCNLMDVRNAKLTTPQVQTLYNGGNPISPTVVGNLISYWDANDSGNALDGTGVSSPTNVIPDIFGPNDLTPTAGMTAANIVNDSP